MEPPGLEGFASDSEPFFFSARTLLLATGYWLLAASYRLLAPRHQLPKEKTMLFEFDPNDRRCRYLRINGARCRSAALDGQDLCFEHKLRKLRTARGRKPTLLPATFNEIPLVSFAWVEDHTSILSNINHIIEAFAHGVIDHRQATAYACLMRTALKTLRQMRDLEDFAVKEKEKPAQRFELDECDLPLAIDESPRVPPVSPTLADTESPEPETCNLPPGQQIDESPRVPPVGATLADTESPEPPPAPCNLQPVTCNLPP
ncbi:MAG: hypothetical protein WBW84_06355, partial [Acidobacteriaceae bacterium]